MYFPRYVLSGSQPVMHVTYSANISLVLLTRGVDKGGTVLFSSSLVSLAKCFWLLFSFLVSSFVAVAEKICSVGGPW